MSRRRSEGEQQREVVSWRLSGQTAAEFAAERKYAPSSLYRWAAGHSGRVPTRPKAESSRQDRAAGARVPSTARPSPGFVRVEVAKMPSTPGPELVVELGDVRIRVGRGFDMALLREVVATLRASTVAR